jgi:hypothetical protein
LGDLSDKSNPRVRGSRFKESDYLPALSAQEWEAGGREIFGAIRNRRRNEIKKWTGLDLFQLVLTISSRMALVIAVLFVLYMILRIFFID